MNESTYGIPTEEISNIECVSRNFKCDTFLKQIFITTIELDFFSLLKAYLQCVSLLALCGGKLNACVTWVKWVGFNPATMQSYRKSDALAFNIPPDFKSKKIVLI